MTASLRTIIPVILLTGTLVCHTAAQDWPQWRGPDRSNRSTETGQPDKTVTLQSKEDGEPHKLLRWTVPLNRSER